MVDFGFTMDEVEELPDVCDWEEGGTIELEESLNELCDIIIDQLEHSEHASVGVEEIVKRLIREDQQSAERRFTKGLPSFDTDDKGKSNKQKIKRLKKPKIDLSDALIGYLYDTITVFDYDCNGYLDMSEVEQLLNVLNIDMTATSLMQSASGKGGVESTTVCKPKEAVISFAAKINQLKADKDEHYLCLLDKESGAYFWFNIIDESSHWVTAEELEQNSNLWYAAYEENEKTPAQEYSAETPTYLAFNDEEEELAHHAVVALSEQAAQAARSTLQEWLTKIKIDPERIPKYVEFFISKGIDSTRQIGAHIDKKPHFLQSEGGFKLKECAIVQQALVKERFEEMILKMENDKESEEARETPADEGTNSTDTIAEDEKDACLVCMENRKCMVFFPCGHLCVCESCDERMNRKQGVLCIICRSEITNRAKLFSA